MAITPQQLHGLLVKAILANHPVLITGAPGIGKTDIVGQATHEVGEVLRSKDILKKDEDVDLIISHPAVSDPTDFKGLPWPDKNSDHANFLPFGEFHRALTATRKTVWFLDDLGQASPAVQAAAMQLLLARRVNGHILPDHVTFVAATNRRTDRAGVSGILEPVKSRFTTIVELTTNLDDWCQWAYGHGIPPMLIAFLRLRGNDVLCNFKANADLTNSPVPRTWANLAKIEALGLPELIENAAMAGAVGEGAAIEYIAFRKLARNSVDIDAILIDPKNAPIPKTPDLLYATVVGLASRADQQTFPKIATYADRLVADRGEYAVLLIRDCIRRDGKLAYTKTFTALNAGKLGQLISGSVK
jgi:hypothetical protein